MINFTQEINRNRHHHFGFPPKTTFCFKCDQPREIITLLSKEVFEQLGWEILFVDLEQTRAISKHTFGEEHITISLVFNGFQIESKSKGTWWDVGRNHRRIIAFIDEFQVRAKRLTSDKISQLQLQSANQFEFTEYAIPDYLSKPGESRSPTILIGLLFGVAFALIAGIVHAEIAKSLPKLIIPASIGVGFGLALAIQYGFRRGNHIDFSKHHLVLLGTTLVFLITSSFYEYFNEPNRNGILDWILLDYLAQPIYSFILLFFKTFMVYILAYAILNQRILSFAVERVPADVIEFVFFLIRKGADEQTIRNELRNKGWTDAQKQDEVFGAVEVIGIVNQEIRK